MTVFDGSSFTRVFRLGVLNTGLRGISIGSKALLVVALSKYLSVEQVGQYGLMTTTLMVGIYMIGLEFHAVATREILAEAPERRSSIIRDQFVLYGCIYILTIPVLFSILVYSKLPSIFLFYFILLLILEHLNQELQRVLIVLERPISSSISFFLRSGIWVFVVIALFFAEPQEADINIVLGTWSIGALLGIVFAIYSLRDFPWKAELSRATNWVWIRRNLFRSAPFLAASLALKGGEASERYFIEFFHDTTLVGVYTYYASIALVIQIILHTTVYSIQYPKAVEYFQAGKIDLYRVVMRRMIVMSFSISILSAVGLIFIIQFLLEFVNSDIYANNIFTFYLLIALSLSRGLLQLIGYALYVRQLDTQLLVSAIVGLILAVIVALIFVPTIGILGSAISGLAGSAGYFLFALYSIKKYKINRSVILRNGRGDISDGSF